MAAPSADDRTIEIADREGAPTGTSRRAVVISVLVDAALLLAFVVIGMPAHALEIDLGEVVTVAAPFLLGWFGAALLVGLYRDPLDPGRAAIAWAIGFAVALLLRRFVWDRGIAFSFIVVAAAFTALELIGWRLLALLWRRRSIARGR